MITPRDRLIREYYRELIDEAGGVFHSAGPSFIWARWHIPEVHGLVYVGLPVSDRGIKIKVIGYSSVAITELAMRELREAFQRVPFPPSDDGLHATLLWQEIVSKFAELPVNHRLPTMGGHDNAAKALHES